MENASKALIIAGAIILAILIIGLGMAVFNQAKDAITGSNMDSEKIGAINAKYEEYLGTAIKGSKARTLCDVIRNNNLSVGAGDTDTVYPVSLTIKIGTATKCDKKTDAASINTGRAAISAAKNCSIVATYDTTTGLINAITITQ